MKNKVRNKIAELYDYNWAYKANRSLVVAVKIGIFTALSEKAMTSEQLSKKCRTKPDMTEKLLIVCAAMGLIEKQGSLYKNSDFSETYLVQGRKLYQGDIIIHSGSIWGFWERLEEEVCLEPLPKDDKEKEYRRFIMAMHNVAVACANDEFIDRIDLTGRKKLIDIGGGAGSYAIAACQRHPKLTAVIFDLPKTIPITKELIEKEGMTDRVIVQPGNWETDNFGKDYDVVLFSHVLYGPKSKADIKLKKAYDSLTLGGLLVIQDFILNNDKTGPLIPAIFNMMVGAYSLAEITSLIQQAGFVQPKVVFVSETDFTWMTAEKLAGR